MSTNTKEQDRMLSALRELVRAYQALAHEREAFMMAAESAMNTGGPRVAGMFDPTLEMIAAVSTRSGNAPDMHDVRALLLTIGKTI